MARVFVVEDNEGLRKTVSSYLRLEEHEVVEFPRLAGLEEAVRMQAPDLIILDIMLPDGDAFPVARRLRAHSPVPIIFLTARTAESDRITGFEVGADDYVVKPFSNKELMLRVRALLRRANLAQVSEPPAFRRWELANGDVTHSGPGALHAGRAASDQGASDANLVGPDAGRGATHVLEVDEEAHRCIHDGRDVTLTAAEWKILMHLADNAPAVISRERLLGVCLDYLAEGSERTIDTHVKNIRMKLDRLPWIDTVRGYGYRFTGQAPGGGAGRSSSAGGPRTPAATEHNPAGSRAPGGTEDQP